MNIYSIFATMKKLISLFTKYKNIILWDKDYAELFRWAWISWIASVLGMWFWYLFLILAWRWFGDEAVWLYSLTVMIFALISAMIGLWIQWSIVRYINQNIVHNETGKIRSMLKATLMYVWSVTIIMMVILYFTKSYIAINIFNEPRLENLLEIIIIILPIAPIYTIWMEMLRWFKMITWYEFVKKIWLFLTKITTLIIIYLTTWTIYGPAYGFLAAIIILAFIAIIGLYKPLKNLPKRIPIDNKQFIITSLPMMITSIAAFITAQTDIFMLGMMMDTSDVWVYQMAISLSILVWFWLNMVNSIIAPQIANLYRSHNIKKLQSILKLWGLVSILVWIPIFLFFMIFPWFFLWIIWKEFLIWSTPLMILAGWQLVNSRAWSAWIYMNMTGKQVVMQYIIIAWAILNVVLNFILIPNYWLTWAAIASCISLSFWNISYVSYIWKTDKLTTFFWS